MHVCKNTEAYLLTVIYTIIYDSLSMQHFLCKNLDKRVARFQNNEKVDSRIKIVSFLFQKVNIWRLPNHLASLH